MPARVIEAADRKALENSLRTLGITAGRITAIEAAFLERLFGTVQKDMHRRIDWVQQGSRQSTKTLDEFSRLLVDADLDEFPVMFSISGVNAWRHVPCRPVVGRSSFATYDPEWVKFCVSEVTLSYQTVSTLADCQLAYLQKLGYEGPVSRVDEYFDEPLFFLTGFGPYLDFSGPATLQALRRRLKGTDLQEVRVHRLIRDAMGTFYDDQVFLSGASVAKNGIVPFQALNVLERMANAPDAVMRKDVYLDHFPRGDIFLCAFNHLMADLGARFPAVRRSLVRMDAYGRENDVSAWLENLSTQADDQLRKLIESPQYRAYQPLPELPLDSWWLHPFSLGLQLDKGDLAQCLDRAISHPEFKPQNYQHARKP